ncbi:MAG: prolyl oligopeptidase family serine peptidase, partial [Bacteroidota bacterium]
LGTTGDVKNYTVGNVTMDIEGSVGGNTAYSSRVQAVCDWYGPSDISALIGQPSSIDRTKADCPEAKLIGGLIKDNPEKAALASPITYVSIEDPPFLIHHGTSDNTVPFNQSVRLDSALRQAGVNCTFIPLTGAGHGGAQFNLDSTKNRVYNFFDKHLKKGGPTLNPINWKPFFTLDSDEAISFVVDTNAVIDNAGVPGLNVTNDNKFILGYGGAVNGRGAMEILDNGNAYQKITPNKPLGQVDGGFIYLPNGQTRFITEEPAPNNTPQKHRSRIVSWISSDGINWTKEVGIRYQPGAADDSISSVASVIQLKDSLWRMYYVGDFYRTNGTRTAVSRDWGITWMRESNGNILRKGDVDPNPVYLSNGKFRLYMRGGMNRPAEQSGVAYCDSDDGLRFDSTQVKILISDTALPKMMKLDPTIIKFPDGKIGCYIGCAPYMQQQGTPKLIVAWGNSKPAGVEENVLQNEELSIKVFPNPIVGAGVIEINSNRSTDVRLELFDILGLKVQTLQYDYLQKGLNRFECDFSGLSEGIYFLTAKAGISKQVCKVVIRK